MYYIKLIGSLAFLLALHCSDATTIWRLECGTMTPIECKEQFGQLFGKVLRTGAIHLLQARSDNIIDAIRRNEHTFDPDKKRRADSLIADLNGCKPQLYEGRNSWNEFKNALRTVLMIGAKNGDFTNEYRQATDSHKDRALKVETPKQVVLNTLELFAGLRPQDYQQIPQWREFENEYNDIKDYKKENEETLKKLNERFADHLGIPRNELDLPS